MGCAEAPWTRCDARQASGPGLAWWRQQESLPGVHVTGIQVALHIREEGMLPVVGGMVGLIV